MLFPDNESIQQIIFKNGIAYSFRINTVTTFTNVGFSTMLCDLLSSGFNNVQNGTTDYYSHPDGCLNQDRTIVFVGPGIFAAVIIILLSHRNKEAFTKTTTAWFFLIIHKLLAMYDLIKLCLIYGNIGCTIIINAAKTAIN